MSRVRIGPRATVRASQGRDAARACVDTFVNRDCLLDATDLVVVGDEVHLAARVQVVTVSHEIGRLSRRAGDVFTRTADTLVAGAPARPMRDLDRVRP
jgi:acetyltransferase-like isoleucine patch superfamily enzyme